MKKILEKKSYNQGWEEGLEVGAATAIDTVISILERERYKNKTEDALYEEVLKTIINKVKEIKND